MTLARKSELGGYYPIKVAKEHGFIQLNTPSHSLQRTIRGDSGELMIGISGSSAPIIQAVRFIERGGVGEAVSMRLHLRRGLLVGVSGIDLSGDENNYTQIRSSYTRRSKDGFVDPREVIHVYYLTDPENSFRATLSEVTISRVLMVRGNTSPRHRHLVMIEGSSLEGEDRQKVLDETGLPEEVDLEKTVRWWTGGIVVDKTGQIVRLDPETFSRTPLLPYA